MVDLSKVRLEIERVCQRLPVKRLGLFGSVLTPEFNSSSDVDVLVVFDSDQSIDFFDKYFDLKEQLEKVFGREVDLIVDKPFKNPIFGAAVEKTRTVIYER